MPTVINFTTWSLISKNTSLVEATTKNEFFNLDRATVEKSIARCFKISWWRQFKDVFHGLRKQRQYAIERARAMYNRHFNNLPENKQIDYLKVLKKSSSLQGLRNRNRIEWDEDAFCSEIKRLQPMPTYPLSLDDINLGDLMDDETMSALWERYHENLQRNPWKPK